MKEYRFVRAFDGIPLTPWRPIPVNGVSATATKLGSMCPKDRIDLHIRGGADDVCSRGQAESTK